MLGTNFDTLINGSPADSTVITIPPGSLTGQVTIVGKLDGMYGGNMTVVVGMASVDERDLGWIDQHSHDCGGRPIAARQP